MTVNAQVTITSTQISSKFSRVTHRFLSVRCELPKKQHIMMNEHQGQLVLSLR
jgi:hypothetical protein